MSRRYRFSHARVLAYLRNLIITPLPRQSPHRPASTRGRSAIYITASIPSRAARWTEIQVASRGTRAATSLHPLCLRAGHFLAHGPSVYSTTRSRPLKPAIVRIPDSNLKLLLPLPKPVRACPVAKPIVLPRDRALKILVHKVITHLSNHTLSELSGVRLHQSPYLFSPTGRAGVIEWKLLSLPMVELPTTPKLGISSDSTVYRMDRSAHADAEGPAQAPSKSRTPSNPALQRRLIGSSNLKSLSSVPCFSPSARVGDGYLDMVATAGLYLAPEGLDADGLRVSDLVNNKELRRLSRRLNLPAYMADPKDFTPNGWVARWKDGYREHPSNAIEVKRKYSADQLEAFVGVVQRRGGKLKAFSICKLLGVRLPQRLYAWPTLQHPALMRTTAAVTNCSSVEGEVAEGNASRLSALPLHRPRGGAAVRRTYLQEETR
ncbi:hypothetical protein BOTBODRAFT_148921 [Botryobasidium botryosum FD-172 SS1]|uniref:Uncharacterized protein n=1 Tax=Botryobasidium botryosum (strain FD-172 SS1) TaxID=930990 RepID=A0A067M002_BOTB1|nr:hypothetical protein BOTBODRAFT_148921 [Botryobasidium botryosum FD-172 SS1]